ncbi:hypothetical protein GQ53DRAFT_779325 [Thozetella sp. PMI_491]|nr:hypothetical protein GQ53DRAFT_779325 [Thozetella sp. PMI_491]
MMRYLDALVLASALSTALAATNETAPSIWLGPFECAGPYCVFANQGFASGRGLVVVSTLASLDRIKAIKFDESFSSEDDGLYHAGEVPGKGLGLIADQKLRRGQRIMATKPVALLHRDFIEGVAPPDQYPVLESAISRLPAASRKKFLSQMGHFGGHQISDILMTNSFQLDVGGADGHHYGNFPDVSRFNHDCRPNVAFYIDSKLNHVTTVVRPVKAGEELSISYLDSSASREERQQRAQMAWGFTCTCSQCSLPAPLAAKSDRRLQEIAELESQLSDFDAKVTPKLIQRVVKAYEEEGLQSKVAGLYTLAALNYNALGDARSAVKYATLADEALAIEFGPGSGDAQAMKAIRQTPREHFTWRARLKS